MLCGELGETFTITLCNFLKSGGCNCTLVHEPFQKACPKVCLNRWPCVQPKIRE